MKSIRFICWSTLFMIVLVPALAQKGPPVHFVKAGHINLAGAVSITIGDLNADGKPDMVVGSPAGPNPVDSGVSVFLGNNDGTFQPPTSYDTNGKSAQSVTIADVNGDGHPDLITATSCHDNFDCHDELGAGSVVLGNGDGTFQPAVSYRSAGQRSVSVAVGDLDGDGHPDIVFADNCQSPTSCANGGVSVLLGNGDGTFKPAVDYNSGGYAAVSVTIGDLNGDGHADVVVANVCETLETCPNGFGAGVVGVLLGNGNGTLQAPVPYSSGGLDARFVRIADVNGDGHSDVVVANGCHAQNQCDQGGVGVLLGNGDGSLQAAVSYSSGGYDPVSLALGEVNGDGHLDVVLAHRCQFATTCPAGGEVAVLSGKGDGTFGSPVHYPSQGNHATDLAIADINSDGKADLLTTNYCHGYFNCGGAVIGILSNNLTVATTMKLKSSVSPSHVNQGVTFTATVKSASSVPDGSTVVFSDGASTLGSATTTNGIAHLATSFSAMGTHVITASYPGDLFHTASSKVFNQVVKP